MEDRDKDLTFTACTPFFLGDVRIDPPALCIERAGSRQRVEAKVMEVLLVLAQTPGQVVSRQELAREVWGGRFVTDDALTNAVGKLRKALDDNPRKPGVIETIAKSGYRLKIEPAPVVADAFPQRASATAATVERPSLRWWLLGVLLLIAVAITAFLNSRSPPESTIPELDRDATASIAVIPFDMLDDDASQTYFAEGITLDLITVLSRIPGLLVIAPGTVFSYRETAADDHTIASELGVRYLIRGGVQRVGDQVRINVRLLEAGRGQALWAERFAGETGSLFKIQDEVMEGIATALPIRLGLSAPPVKRSGATASIAAYDELLRGRERYGRLTLEDNRIALLHFKRAIALDPGFARAYAGLALTWSRLAIDGWTEDTEGALSKAAEYAEHAASIDASVPQIHFVRAQVELFRGQHERAAAAATTAIELDPNYADAYALLAWILHYAGRPDRAEAALGEALRRNPSSSASYREIAGEIFFATGHYGKAAKEFEAALERNPAHTRARLWLAATLSKLGRPEEAAWEVEELLVLNPEFSLSRLLFAFPLKDPHQRDALIGALAQLGLPE
ncbi:MAG: tetratricopeptide repeat protein [Chromatiaceae bacterium]|nr:tetratricopeptide repeat protein [Chromatiaceae bacterium]